MYISLPSMCDYDVKIANFARFIDNVNIPLISLIFLNLDIFLKNSAPGEIASSKKSQRVGIVALKCQTRRSHFFEMTFSPPWPSWYLKLLDRRLKNSLSQALGQYRWAKKGRKHWKRAKNGGRGEGESLLASSSIPQSAHYPLHLE